MFKVGDVVKLKQEVIDRDIKEDGWNYRYTHLLSGGFGEIVSVDEDMCSVHVPSGVLYLEPNELVSADNVENAEFPHFKLERVGERVTLEINGKLSKETIEKIFNLVW